MMSRCRRDGGGGTRHAESPVNSYAHMEGIQILLRLTIIYFFSYISQLQRNDSRGCRCFADEGWRVLATELVNQSLRFRNLPTCTVFSQSVGR
ncbi:hypothetical protein Ancab_030048 [Ancistrocladus abbreviatus]